MLVQLIFWLTFFISFSFVVSESALMIGIFSLVFSLLNCLIIMYFLSTWFMAITIIVYVGGLLVMFSYFLAVFPNQQVSAVYVVIPFVFVGTSYACAKKEIFFFFDCLGGMTDVDYLFHCDNGFLLVLLILSLLLCLLSVVSVVKLSQGPLRPYCDFLESGEG